MTKIDREMLLMIIGYIDTCPPRDADPHTRVEAREAIARGLESLTDAELYDLVQRFGDREPHCEVHPFMHTLCNLKRFYERPEDAVVMGCICCLEDRS